MDIEVTVLDGRDDNPFLDAILSNRTEPEPTPAEKAKATLDDLLKPEDVFIWEPDMVDNVEDAVFEELDEVEEVLALPSPEDTLEVKCRRVIKQISNAMVNVRKKRAKASTVRKLVDEVLPLFNEYRNEHPSMPTGVLVLSFKPKDPSLIRVQDITLSKSIGSAFKMYDRFEERVAVVLAFAPFLGPYKANEGHILVKPSSVKLK